MTRLRKRAFRVSLAMMILATGMYYLLTPPTLRRSIGLQHFQSFDLGLVTVTEIHYYDGPRIIIHVPKVIPAFIWILSAFVGWRLARDSMREQQRRRSGLCLKCGYDLRATKDRCPECGEPISSAST